MNITFKNLKNIHSDYCVSIILNTHRTSPDNEKDEILLKNLIKDAEKRLLEKVEKKVASQIIDKMHDLESKINHRHNLESLIMFVNEDIADYKRLPIPVENRVVIDKTFATRDLIRALHQEANYYVLVLSRDKARLIEAFNDKEVEEVSSPFPLENSILATNSSPSADAPKQSNLISEYFNQVDKATQDIYKVKAIPVLVCTEESNFYEYQKIIDNKRIYFEDFLNGSRIAEKGQNIVSDAWKIVDEYTTKKNHSRKQELQKAVSENKFLSDATEIYNAIRAGRVQTLFVEQGLYQPAKIENEKIIYISPDQRDDRDGIDDIYDELIELNADFGGDVVFLPKGELDDFCGFGATTRY